MKTGGPGNTVPARTQATPVTHGSWPLGQQWDHMQASQALPFKGMSPQGTEKGMGPPRPRFPTHTTLFHSSKTLLMLFLLSEILSFWLLLAASISPFHLSSSFR